MAVSFDLTAAIRAQLDPSSLMAELPSLPVPSIRPPSPQAVLSFVTGLAPGIEGGVPAGLHGFAQGLETLATVASFAGPVGGAIAIGAKIFGGVASFFGGLFGGSDYEPPPATNVGGVSAMRLQENPLRDGNYATIAAYAVAKRFGTAVSAEARIAIHRAAESKALLALEAMTGDPSDVSSADEVLRRNNASLRALAYYLSYIDYEQIFGQNTRIGLPKYAPAIASILAWAAPRVQLREILVQYAAYKHALGVEALTNGRCEARFPAGRREVRLFPGGPSFTVGDDSGRLWVPESAWPNTRLLCHGGTATSAVWKSNVTSLCIPSPSYDAQRDIWAYHPIDKFVLADELDYYTRFANSYYTLWDNLGTSHVFKFHFPNTDDGVDNLVELESPRMALRNAFRMASESPAPDGWVESVRITIENAMEMQSGRRPPSMQLLTAKKPLKKAGAPALERQQQPSSLDQEVVTAKRKRKALGILAGAAILGGAGALYYYGSRRPRRGR